MAMIDNPKFSRPIDVHRWSDHPEVVTLVEDIWNNWLPPEVTGELGKKKPGPRRKTSLKKQLRVLVLDLYVAWLENPELSIGISMDVTKWKTNSRYNALHLSKGIIPLVRALATAHLLDLSTGSYSGPGAKGNRTTRIRDSETQQEFFRREKFYRNDIGRFEGEEIIILRDAKEATERGKQIEYEDTPAITAMRSDLKAYNDVVMSSFIDVITLKKPEFEIISGLNVSVVPMHPDTSRSRRVFSRSDWSMNGRFYGGWWQRISGELRSEIFIDDQPTIEVDFKGLHIAMLHAQAGKEMRHDPYNLGGETIIDPEAIILGLPAKLTRKLCKRLALTAINAKKKSSAFKAFREGIPMGQTGKSMSDEKLDQMLKSFLDINPDLSNSLFSDKGIELMYLDSQITARVHNHFTKQGIPVLSVHDSYIIDYMRVTELQEVMAEASRAVVGQSLPTSIKLPDMAEYSDVSHEELQAHINKRKGSRCLEYMERLFAYQERTGRSISPAEQGDMSIIYS